MSFPNLPAEYEDPWYTKFINWATSVQNRITGTETVANAAATKAYADGIKTTADAALPSTSFDTRLATRVKVDNTAGRTASVWDSTNSRWQLVYGDTGWRDITSFITNGTAPSAARIRRSGWDVELRIIGWKPAAAGSNSVWAAGSSPVISGLRPGNTIPILANQSGAATWGSLAHDGSTFVVNASGTSSTDMLMQWKTTEAWPTTLPGTAVGSIPNA